ncbi:MAG TPA: hemolysin family protein [Rhodanobacteraceae bacterium]|nr:hemolysin family protein [Rhodanobacteraceae bacterium]
MLPELGLVLLLALANGFFALSEIAIIASRKSRLQQMGANSARARTALKLVTHPESILSTVQVGITLISIVTGIATGASIGTDLGHWLSGLGWPALAHYALPLGMFLSVAAITFINIVVGELVPKRAALLAPERIATQVAVPMLLLSRAVTPFVWVLNQVSSALLRLFGMARVSPGVVSEEEIRMLVAESAEQGVLDADERNMVNRVLRLGDRSVDSLMTPRTRIAWLDSTAEPAQNLAVLRQTPYARYPVIHGDEKEIIGIVEVKRLLDFLGRPRQELDLFRHLAKPLYVPATARAMDLLDEFREAETSMALVVDEYGDIEGLVTLNDLLGTVVGRGLATTPGATDSEAPVVQRDDGSYLVDGSLSSDDLRELLALTTLPNEDEHDFRTVAGLMMAEFGHIPGPGEHFTWRDLRFEVMDLDGARIDKVLVSRLVASEDDGSG